jgi:hypothetical protein
MPFRPETYHLVIWTLVAEAVLLVLNPKGRWGKMLLGVTTFAVLVALATWCVMIVVD